MRSLSMIIAGLLMSTALANAADHQAVDPKVEEFNLSSPWQGVYVGASVGKVRAFDSDPAFPIAPPVTIPLDSKGESTKTGVFVGVSFQNGKFVYGLEYEYADLDTQFIGIGLGPIPVFIEDAHILKGRLGYAVSDRMHVYGFGGQMRTRINIGLDDWSPIVGAGVEFKFEDNVVLGAEYMHSWFDGYDGTLISGTFDTFSVRVSALF